MVGVPYDWKNGVDLDRHTERKLKVIKEYFRAYLLTRCQLPKRNTFRIAVVDGFAGGGRYNCGAAGSPIIFLEGIRDALTYINVKRASEGGSPFEIECLFAFNDFDLDAISLLKERCAPIIADIQQNYSNLHVTCIFSQSRFESYYSEVKNLLIQKKYKNVIFSLDQCGDKNVNRTTIIDILNSFRSAEIFYNITIEPLVKFLTKNNIEKAEARLRRVGVDLKQIAKDGGVLSKSEWMGAVEKIVFDAFNECSPYASPFSIHNPEGWRYWFIHFAKSYRARQVYNNILHENATSQAHFGRSGLEMLMYSPDDDGGSLYLFDTEGRRKSKEQLLDDIPRFISEKGDAISVLQFYQGIYNTTPAHSDDINSALINSADLEVLTPTGNCRRSEHQIQTGDTIRLKKQTNFFPLLRQKEEK